ncbi:MAG: hypothetical protein WD407_09490 [Rhodospirillales bacterium]
MKQRYAVGMNVNGKPSHAVIEAEDALIAALIVKTEYPEAAITYARRRNKRGDRRNPGVKIKP